jgi:hypothetical protein
VIGPINPKTSKGHVYIITAIDYFNKWQEVVLKNIDSEQFNHFPKRKSNKGISYTNLVWLGRDLKNRLLLLLSCPDLVSRFGVLEKFITKNGSIFIGSNFTNLCGEYGIIIRQSSNYYP